MILGEKIPYTGETQVGTGIKISYVPQDASFLQGSLEDMALEYDLDESLFKGNAEEGLDLERGASLIRISGSTALDRRRRCCSQEASAREPTCTSGSEPL